ncbi:corticotropin-releasing factor-binding protein isoform X2 [Onthophagus taurus]|uniref:corticotropin-releasing factor-binding protein isoform X2 n=1 Tax=Onthophagus taurus TaxID=166361 RepID=UPI000C208B8C|nr:corticotropin-releasing factor-binding protein isoform X2 [Onthophagus taurus]
MILWTVTVLSCCCVFFAEECLSTPLITQSKLSNKHGLEFLRHRFQSIDKPEGVSSRRRRSSETAIIECMEMITEEGVFYHTASHVNNTCGIYIFTAPDEKIELKVSYLDVPCENDGAISLLDGWEMNGEIFPNEFDHPNPNSRVLEVCGRRKIKDGFRTTQNAAMILYRMPRRNSGFRFSIRFLKNPRPCNVLLQDFEATLTLRNYASRSNCTIVSLFPAEVRVLSLSVGVVSTMGKGIELETGTVHKCNKRGLDDFLQIGGSTSLDTSQLLLTDAVCGMDSKASRHTEVINCDYTVVRLVSSGAFDNSVIITMKIVSSGDQATFNCPKIEV